MTGDDGLTVTGYNASLNVNVTIRDIEAVGSTIDVAQQAGGAGFTIGGVSFSFADPESVLEQARIDAVANARTKAEQYAAAAGVDARWRREHRRGCVVPTDPLRRSPRGRRHGHGRRPLDLARAARPDHRHLGHVRHPEASREGLTPAASTRSAQCPVASGTWGTGRTTRRRGAALGNRRRRTAHGVLRHAPEGDRTFFKEDVAIPTS